MQLLTEGLLEALRLIVSLDPQVVDAAWRSLWISTVAVSVGSVVGVAIGLLLARVRFAGRGLLTLAFRAGMAIPTVLIGLTCFAMFSRRGPLGSMELLYTPWAIIVGQFLLALPIVVTWTQGAVSGLDPRLAESARTLGAGRLRRWRTYLSETRVAIMLAVLTAFARCFTELGVAMLVGGNLLYRTRTLTTATAMETSRGEFARGVAMSLILLLMAMLLTVAIAWLMRKEDER